MQVSHVEKNMVKQSSTVPQSIYKEQLNHTFGLTFSTPGLVSVSTHYCISGSFSKLSRQMCDLYQPGCQHTARSKLQYFVLPTFYFPSDIFHLSHGYKQNSVKSVIQRLTQNLQSNTSNCVTTKTYTCGVLVTFTFLSQKFMEKISRFRIISLIKILMDENEKFI